MTPPDIPRSPSVRRAIWLALFACAMGVLEAVVVVYLREIYYPRGFAFPLVRIPDRMAAVEMLREAATLVMLVSVATLVGRDRLDRFFVFGFLFGVWDLLYYAGLKGLLGWPESLLAWDVLFLIPVPWVGPVLGPVLVSVALAAGFVAHDLLWRRGARIRPSTGEWWASTAGALAVVVSFCWRFRTALEGTEPGRFPWTLYAAGLCLAVVPMLRAGIRALRALPAQPSS